MRLIVFGTYDAEVHPRVAVVAEGLSDRGHEVIECNAPLGIDTAGRVAMLRQTWRAGSFLLRLGRRWMRLCARAWRLPSADAVIVGYMGHFDVHLARLLFPRAPLVLDHLIGATDTARDRGEHGRIKLASLDAIDHSALSSADLIMVDTEEQRSLLPSRVVGRSVVVPVGATHAWFEAGDMRCVPLHERRTGAGLLKVVFFGLFTPLQGTLVIGRALRMLQNDPVEVTMIGNGQDRQAAETAAQGAGRVRWIDWVSAERLPSVVAAHHVCLGIFGDTPKSLRVVPNKVFQGAAAGCAIVTSDTHPQRRALEDAALYVPPGDASALARTLRELAHDPMMAASVASAATRRARECFAPGQIVMPLIDRLVHRSARE
jgi:glycosyltransferase involved in cell wall biosynthesis